MPLDASNATSSQYRSQSDIDPNLRATLARPHIRLAGSVDENLYKCFHNGLCEAPSEGPIVIALTTLGGDPEIARAMGDDLRLLRESENREFLFLGTAAVYSAGATFMSNFPAAKRFFTKDTWLMIHERQMHKELKLDGPLRTIPPLVKAVMHELDTSIEIEEEGFRALIKGSKVDFEDLRKKVKENWYVQAGEAKELGLIAGVV